MQRSGAVYTLVFSTIVCVVCAALVTGAAVVLKERQGGNVVLDRQRNVLSVAGLIQPGESLSREETQNRFEQSIVTKVVDLATGAYAGNAEQLLAEGYNMVLATRDPALSAPAPANPAGIMSVPKYGVVYQVMKDGQPDMFVLTVWGRGLWSTMYGFLALDKDGNTVRGLTFYEQGETPGLGGEVDNPKWKAQWPGRKVYGEDGTPAITMVKGGAGAPEQNPHKFDGISGATITSRAVQSLINFWLGESGYQAYLKQFRQ